MCLKGHFGFKSWNNTDWVTISLWKSYFRTISLVCCLCFSLKIEINYKKIACDPKVEIIMITLFWMKYNGPWLSLQGSIYYIDYIFRRSPLVKFSCFGPIIYRLMIYHYSQEPRSLESNHCIVMKESKDHLF